MSVPAQPGLEGIVNTTGESSNGAQSPVPSPAAFAHGASGERTFSAEEIAKARQDEKNKLYPRMEKLESQLSEANQFIEAFRKQQEEAAKLAEQAQKEEEAKERKAKEDAMSVKDFTDQRVESLNASWEEKFNRLQAERDQERAILEKERAYNELVDYRNSRLAEAAAMNEIAPQFHDFITGDTREQIDSAIERAKAATTSIAQETSQLLSQTQQQPRGVSATGYAAFGPMEGVLGQKTYTPDDINQMSMKEYSEWRLKAGIGSGEAARNRGILG
jgi:chromosome segregation ATPase